MFCLTRNKSLAMFCQLMKFQCFHGLSRPIHKLAKCMEKHVPVMSREVIEALDPKDGHVYLDLTFGAGGHTRKILQAAKDVKVYALDRDPNAYQLAKDLEEEFRGQVFPMLGRFSELGGLLEKAGLKHGHIDGILIDCGCSSMQFDNASRGFSLSYNGPLDMRMDGSRFPNQPTAADVVNSLDAGSLAKVFKMYGEEKRAKKIAQAIIDSRFMLKNIRTTWQLAEVIGSVFEDSEERHDKLQRPAHIATKAFMALRIFVNNELNELNYAVQLSHELLSPNGRLVVLTFHSLEDRIVKRHFGGIDMDEPVSSSFSQKYRNAAQWHTREEMEEILHKDWDPIYKKILVPTEEEIFLNPRSRSAKLRAARKI